MTGTKLKQMIGWIMLACYFPFVFLSCSMNKSPVAAPYMEIKMDKKEEPTPSYFVLGAGDELTINVWRNEDLHRTVKIDPSGMVQIPLAGKIQASGLTTSELSDKLTEKLSEYLVDPQVDINAITIRSQRAYVLGEVKAPGVIQLDHPTFFWDALAQSGGFTREANQQSVLLIRKDRDTIKIYVLNMDIKMQIGTEQFIAGYYLRDKDIIYVPISSIADYSIFAQRLASIINPIIGFEQLIILTPQVIDALKGIQQSGAVVVPH